MWAAGRDVRPLPLRERKQLLRGLLSFDDPLRFTEHRDADGEAYWQAACAQGWEGVIAKRADAPYHSGRSRDWLKFKCEAGQEFVIGGYTDPQGSRTGFGALLLGYYDRDGRLTYAGKVGTGFDQRALASLHAALAALERDRPAFERGALRGRGCTGSNPASSARSASANGRLTGSCAIPGSRACGGTRIPPRWSGRHPDRAFSTA